MKNQFQRYANPAAIGGALLAAGVLAIIYGWGHAPALETYVIVTGASLLGGALDTR